MDKQAELILRLQSLSDLEIAKYIWNLQRKYEKYAISPEEGRRRIDETMGDATFDQFLRQDRENGL